MKITNLGKLPIEQKGKLPSDENKIKITKESSQVKKENSQSLKIIKIKGKKERFKDFKNILLLQVFKYIFLYEA